MYRKTWKRSTHMLAAAMVAGSLALAAPVLAAHIGFGITLGLLTQRFLHDEDAGWLGSFLAGPARPERRELQS